MEEIVFNALLKETKCKDIEEFIAEIVANNESVTYEEVRESILKLVLYRFIKVNTKATSDCIYKRTNFYQAQELGSVNSWLERQRRLNG